MKIASLTDIVEGRLLNTPAISFVTQIQTDIKKVNEGDAFISNNKQHIQEAVLKGAFAIVSTGIKNIADTEIAWIEVDNIESSILKVLRYKLLNKNITFIHIDHIFYHFLLLYKANINKNILVLSNNTKKNYNLISKNNDKITVIYSTQRYFLDQISPNVKDETKYSYKIHNFIDHSLFEVSFSYRDIFFDRLHIPFVYINSFIKIYKLCKQDLEIKKLNQLELFKPIFLNKRFQIVPNGQSNKFLLCNKNNNISKKEISYLKKRYTYGKFILLDTKNITKEKLVLKVKQLDFNLLYLKNIDYQTLANMFSQEDKIKLLF
jgi:ferrochelatase